MCICCEPQYPSIPFDPNDEDLNSAFDGIPYTEADR